jgi:spermidine synthase
MRGSGAVGALFFLSGLSGLVYEVVWTRLLVLVMGNTVFSVTTVLCAFMGGLALGGFLGGRAADRLARPLRTYAWLEAAIGALGLLVPLLVRGLAPVHAAVYGAVGDSPALFGAWQFVACGLVLMLPSTLMGATLPVLARHVARDLHRVGGSVGRLYAANTFGAVAGAFLTGFVLVPTLGLWRTTITAALLNGAIAAIAARLKAAPDTPPAPEPAAPKKKAKKTATTADGAPVPAGAILAARAAAGFASMVDQVAWTRVLSLLLGGTVYAFALMVGTFILGLAAGGAAASAIVDRLARPASALATTQALAGATCAALVVAFTRLPGVVVDMTRSETGFGAAYLARFGLVVACLIVPTTLMGAAFPIAARLLARRADTIGRTVGSVYSANTLGAIAGAFAGGFVLIPALGLRATLLAAAALNIGTALLVIAAARRAEAAGAFVRWAPTLAAAAALLWVAARGPWDASAIASGAYIAAARTRGDDTLARERRDSLVHGSGELIFYKEGPTATVGVRKNDDGTLSLQTNGKTDASTSYDMRSQVLVAHIPAMLARRQETALVIGFGSGITSGSVARHTFRTLHGVEISAEIAEAARRFFGPHNYDVSSDPRARLTIGDARTFLALRETRYDVITSEPSNLWIAGMGNLFSVEFFRAARARLQPGGVVGQWLNAYELRPEEFRTVIRTFLNVFPHVTLWEVWRGVDYLLVGSEEPQSIDSAALARLETTDVDRDLSRIHLRRPGDVAAAFMAGTDSLRALAGPGPLHTDDNGLLEYAAPRTLHRSMSAANLAALAARIDPPGVILRGEASFTGPLSAYVAARRAARDLVLAGEALMREGQVERGMEEWERALAVLPDERAAVDAFKEHQFAAARAATGAGQIAEALRRVLKILRVDPDDPHALNVAGRIALTTGQFGDALGFLEHLHRLRPDTPELEEAIRAARQGATKR